jgi:hypothetical protein
MSRKSGNRFSEKDMRQSMNSATCREACCGATPRLTVSELFERGFRRRRAAPLPIEGARCSDVTGVPPLKRDRAVLAVAAFRAALLAAASSHPQTDIGKNDHESRLHLRHPAP